MSGSPKRARVSPVEAATGKILKESFFPKVTAFSNRGAEGIYQGSRLAAQSEGTDLFQQQLQGALPGLQQGADAAQGNLGGFFNPNVQGVEDTFLNTLDAQNARDLGIRDNLIDTFGQAAGTQFRRNILPGINDAAAGAGQFGSSRQGVAQGVAASDVASGLNSQIAQLLQSDVARQDANRRDALGLAFAERSGELERSLQASSLYPQLQQAQLLPLSLQEQLGQSQEQRAQLELEDMIQQQESGRNAELQALQETQGLIGFAGPGQFTGSVTGGGASDLQTAAGVATIVSAFNS